MQPTSFVNRVVSIASSMDLVRQRLGILAYKDEMVCFGSKADIADFWLGVRLGPKAEIVAAEIPETRRRASAI